MNSIRINTLLLIFAVVYLLLAALYGSLILTEDTYLNIYGSIVSVNQIEKMISHARATEWLSYIFFPLFALIRAIYTAICIYVGCLLRNQTIKFRYVFKVSIVADLVYVFALLNKLIILGRYREIKTLNDFNYQPLSILELFKDVSIDQYLLYPLSLLNLYELFYWTVLTVFISASIRSSKKEALKTIIYSYGVGMIIWVSIVVYISINITT